MLVLVVGQALNVAVQISIAAVPRARVYFERAKLTIVLIDIVDVGAV